MHAKRFADAIMRLRCWERHLSDAAIEQLLNGGCIVVNTVTVKNVHNENPFFFVSYAEKNNGENADEKTDPAAKRKSFLKEEKRKER